MQMRFGKCRPEEVHVDDGCSHEHVEEVDEDGDEDAEEAVALLVEEVPQLGRVADRVVAVRVRQVLKIFILQCALTE